MANLTLSEMLTIRNCLIKEVKENEKTVETAERYFLVLILLAILETCLIVQEVH